MLLHLLWLTKMFLREFMTTPVYLSLDRHIELIDEPNRSICAKILADHRTLFETAPGSTYNHQTWPGGYIDHVTDGMNYGRHLYALEVSTGRPTTFSLSDVLLIFFLHDIEKPWRIFVSASGFATNKSGLDTKSANRSFREQKLREYGINLTSAQMNALTYVEGEGGDYSSKHRVMNELAAFCHMIDVWSARVRHDYPKVADVWVGAGRFRTQGASNGLFFIPPPCPTTS